MKLTRHISLSFSVVSNISFNFFLSARGNSHRDRSGGYGDWGSTDVKFFIRRNSDVNIDVWAGAFSR